MRQMILRLPESLHRALKEIAEEENISANQFVTLAVAEKISALAAVELMARRAAEAPDRARFEALLRRAPGVDPGEDGEL